MRQHNRGRHRTRSRKRTCAALAFAGVLIATLAACERSEPTQEAVLDEAYLVYPNATKIEEDFEQGTSGGLMNVDGGAPSSDPSQLSIHYRLDRPTPPEDIRNWYENQLTTEGWTVESPRGPSSTKLSKEVGDRRHYINISPVVPDPESDHGRYKEPEEGEAATHYLIWYIIGRPR